MRISNKRDLLEEVKSKLLSRRFKITGQEYSQIWGGSLLTDESQAADSSNLLLRPKILLVSPNRGISWQYHRVEPKYGKLFLAKWESP